ncbi:hypothetical protein YTPLAS72_15210 [Nitrospira sp.]|nr:hypothetical protein YTPLAS72_15210 [Nitrospira sp.]
MVVVAPSFRLDKAVFCTVSVDLSRYVRSIGFVNRIGCDLVHHPIYGAAFGIDGGAVT